jgi:site-specific recombinase XerD
MQLSEALQEFDLAKTGVTSPATRRWYQARLKSLMGMLGDAEIETITARDLRLWRAYLVDKKVRWDNHPHRVEQEGGLSPTTLYDHVSACRIFFRWLAQEGLLAENPASQFKLPPLPKDEPKKDISQENAVRIINAARGNLRNFAILRFLADTGCRACGVAGLRLRDIKLEPDKVGRYRATVYEKGRGGKKKVRRVYFKPLTAIAIAEYLKVRPEIDADLVPEDDVDRIWVKQQSGRPKLPLQEEGIYRMIERYAKALKIKGKWNPHAWRHAFAHGILDNGGDLKILSQLMGHGGIQVTADAYGYRVDKILADHHAQYSWLDNEEDE